LRILTKKIKRLSKGNILNSLSKAKLQPVNFYDLYMNAHSLKQGSTLRMVGYRPRAKESCTRKQ